MWGFLFQFAISLVLSYVLRPSQPKQADAQPQEFEPPETQEGTPIPVIFGTVKMKNPAVLWYGDLDTIPIYAEEGGKK